MQTQIEPSDAAAKQYQMTTAIPAGILLPDTLETRLGTLRSFDGLPDAATG